MVGFMFLEALIGVFIKRFLLIGIILLEPA